ncbi:hypothetical protein D6833_11250 [Candidatus Parcubacteria bacterium]|nr:MAG: hypothetical protein D6833_11250 [Candidatus Parcubacteria bacterium]
MPLRPEIEAAVERNQAFSEPARWAAWEAVDAKRARRARRWLRLGDYMAAALIGLFFGAFSAVLGLLVFLFGVWLIHRGDRPGLPPPWRQETPEEAFRNKLIKAELESERERSWWWSNPANPASPTYEDHYND